VDDSKCLTAFERERAANASRSSAVALTVAEVRRKVIDRINILEATRKHEGGAFAAAAVPDCAVIDAVSLSGFRFPCFPVVRGDCFSYAVACASSSPSGALIRMMVDLDRTYPQYGFASHKGYSVPEHLAALSIYGPLSHPPAHVPACAPREARC